MLKKTVKCYTTKNNVNTYRINLGKKDNLNNNQDVIILTIKEYENLKNTSNKDLKIYEKTISDKEKIISDNKNKIKNLENTISDLNKKIDNLNKDIKKLNYNLLSLSDENKNLIKSLSIKEIIINKYKDRGFLDRLLNKTIDLNNNDITLIETKNLKK